MRMVFAALAIAATASAATADEDIEARYLIRNEDGAYIPQELPVEACNLVRVAFVERILTFADGYVEAMGCAVRRDIIITPRLCEALQQMVKHRIGVPSGGHVAKDCRSPNPPKN